MGTNFANLTIRESSEGVTRTRSGGKYADNPLMPQVKQAAEAEGKPFFFTIPQADVAEAETLLRAAADELGKGIAISYPSKQVEFTNRKGKPAKRREATPDDKGKTKVTFEVRPRREVKRRTAAEIAATATPDAPAQS